MTVVPQTREFPFEIIPAIDIRSGRCVRLFQGRFDAETVYSEDPVSVARQWQKEGACRLHIVDLDGARDGFPRNGSIIDEIVKAVTIPVQLGGGIREERTIEDVLLKGVQRVIIGTRALSDAEFTKRVCARWNDAIIIGIDTKDDRVAVRGWQEVGESPGMTAAKQMEQLGARRIICTDIGRDGTLQGPNLKMLQEIAEAIRIPLIASGGISCRDDVVAVSRLSGIEGVIVGKALYTGNLNLSDAITAIG